MYKDLKFPIIEGRPFFYTNFVETVDGKVQVTTENQGKYWPIGSQADHNTLIELRSHADVMIHGKNTAYGPMENILKLNSNLVYTIITSKPDEKLLNFLKPVGGKKAILATTEEAEIPAGFENDVNIVRLGRGHADIQLLSKYLFEQGYKNILVEGGPHVLGSFFKADLIDEVFLTIAPKIFGNEPGKALTLVEGHLFPADQIKKLELLSVKQVENELYLRYKILH